jgi:hypothetical protein
MRHAYLFLILGTVVWSHSPSNRPEPAASPHLAGPGPLIKQLDSSTFRLLLPPTMKRLLEDSAPGFELWPWQHYDRDVHSVYVISHRTAPSAIIGDFNGDGVQDVVMEGHDRHRVLRLCLLSQDDDFTFIMLQSGPWSSTAVDPRNQISYLSFRGPGHIGTNYNDEAMVLRTDGFEVITVDKAAVLYYWNGKAFVEFQTAD